MKVRAKSLALSDGQIEAAGANLMLRPKYSLSLGKCYVVLGIYFPSFSKIFGRSAVFRLVDDDGSCIPCPAQLFDIVSDKPSQYWRARISETDFFLFPEEFYEQYFFDDLLEGVPSVEAKFIKIRGLLEEEADELLPKK